MKALFFEGRYTGKIDLSKLDIDALPKYIALLTTVQFLDSLDAIKKHLEKNGKKVILPKGIHAAYKGQALGCSLIAPIAGGKNSSKGKDSFDAFLYVGDGLFHPKQLMLKNDLPVFAFDPKANLFKKLNEKDIDVMRKRIKGALLKFYTSTKIGIIVSTKPGQNKLGLARKLKAKLQKEGKEAYLFISDTIDFNEMENFPFIEVFVNTACPRIAYDDYEKFARPIIDIDDLN